MAGRQWENDRVDYRKWTIGLGASLGTVLLVAAMYAAMITRSWCNGSGVGTCGRGDTCWHHRDGSRVEAALAARTRAVSSSARLVEPLGLSAVQ